MVTHPMLTETKKKMCGKKRKKNCFEIWTGSFPQNLASIRFTVSEKNGVYGRTDERTDYGRTTDARGTTVALLRSITKQS